MIPADPGAGVAVESMEFRFKGDRDYIHGTDMFNALVGTAAAGAVRNIRFTIHGLVRTPRCQVYRARSREALEGVPHVRVRAGFERDGIPQWLALTEVPGSGPAGRYEYREERVTSLCTTSPQGIELESASPFTFIETVVAMNKHLHQSRFPDAAGKWLFTGIELSRGCEARQDLALRLGPDPSLRLTRAQIVHRGESIGSLFFSLVKT